MDLVKIEKDDYERYEELLLRRDAYRKEAKGAQILYVKEFGELITRSFQEQVSCIAKKKCIAFYQAAANRGETVNLEEVNAYLRETMAEYDQQLKEMLQEYEAARGVKFVSEDTAMKVRKLYRQIAKLIHPDMHPDLQGNEIWNDLWEQAMDAYHRNDLEALQEVEVLVHRALQENGGDTSEIVIPNLEERITAVRDEIEKITSTDPYLYKRLLKDPEAVEEKKQDLREEIEKYRAYGDELDQVLKEFLKGGVIITWPMN